MRIKFDIRPYTRPGIYRHFDAMGQLLYLGSTKNFLARTGHHASKGKARWFHQICFIEFEPMPLDQAVALEPTLIAVEQPLFNVVHRSRPPSKPVAPTRFERMCPTCRVDFIANRADTVYCCDPCRGRASYHRKNTPERRARRQATRAPDYRYRQTG